MTHVTQSSFTGSGLKPTVQAENVRKLRKVSYDALWDKTFADTQDLLDRLADEAHEDYVAGRTEDFDPDAP